MKQRILSACFLLLAACLAAPVQTIEAKSKIKKELVGLWQSFQGGRPRPFFKMLNANGTFGNFGQTTIEGMVSYAQQGKFKITSDSTYIEYIEKSPIPGYTGYRSEIRYQLLQSGKILLTKWKSPQTGLWSPEIWIRVE